MNKKVLKVVSIEREILLDYIKRLRCNVEDDILGYKIALYAGESDDKFNATLERLCNELGDNIYAQDCQTLPQIVGDLLSLKGASIGVAESCTGGLLSHLITQVSGSSAYFKGAIIAYNNVIKEKILGISHDIIKRNGVVSESVAKLMSKNIANLLETDIGIGITGIAGPTTVDHLPVGLVYIGLHIHNGELVKRWQLCGSRQQIQLKAALLALDMLRRQLLQC